MTGVLQFIDQPDRPVSQLGKQELIAMHKEKPSGNALDFQKLFSISSPNPIGRDAMVRRGKYDFAVAYPDPDSLPLNPLMESLREALETEGAGLAIYPHPQGYPPLREFVAEKLARDRGIHVSTDDLILGDGSGEPIDMLCQILLNPGDVVFTDDFVYSGTLNTFRRYQAEIHGIPSDHSGMLPDVLEFAIQQVLGEGKRPKLIYLIPSYQNPQGWTMPQGRRLEMLDIARRSNIPILEDDCYADLRYSGDSPPSIHSLDSNSGVMYVGSFSKVIAPGMRMGYMTAPADVLAKVKAVKSGGGVNQFAALAIYGYAVEHLESHIEQINGILRGKRDAMLAALGENFGSSAEWSYPDGGLYIWLKMPDNADLVSTRQLALDAEVGYHPGSLFAPDGTSGRNCARLCYGYNTPNEIHEGISILARVLERAGVV